MNLSPLPYPGQRDPVQQRRHWAGIALAAGRQGGGDDGVGRRVDRQVELAPGPPPAHAVFVAVPLAGAVDLQPGAVDHQGDRAIRQGGPQRWRQECRPPADRRVIGNRQVNAHEVQQRSEQPLGLAQRLVKHQPDHEGCLDRCLRVARLTAGRRSRRCRPGCDGLVADPQRQAATPLAQTTFALTASGGARLR